MTIDPETPIRDVPEVEGPHLDASARAEDGFSARAEGDVEARLAEAQRRIEAAETARRLAEERLALAFQASDGIGWWDWDVAADRCRANAGFARLFGLDPQAAAEGLPRATFTTHVLAEDRGRVEARINTVFEHGGTFTDEFRIRAPDGNLVWILSRGRCETDGAGRVLRCSGVSIDITERKASDARKSALVELGDAMRDVEDLGEIAFIAAEVMAKALGATRAGFGMVDPARDTVMMQPDWRAPGVETLAGLHHFRDYGSFIDDLKRGESVIIPDVADDPRTVGTAEALAAIGIRCLVNLPILEHGRFVFVVFVHHDLPHAWSGPELAFVRNVADRTQAAIGRLRAEDQRRLLHRELGHRLKNNQAMVQAIVSQTLRNAPDLAAARLALTQRIEALGRAHDVLFSGEVQDADARTVIEGALALHDDGQGRICLEGPSLRIAAPVALSLSLVLHELATNAVKYGALSVPEGHVRLVWSIDRGSDGEEVFQLDWQEMNGPSVATPTRKGFGTKLIERGLAGSANGKARIDFPAGGFTFRLTAPLAEIGNGARI